MALAVACPVGGLTLSHVAYLLNLATKMAKANGLHHNKALIFARWVATCAAASASGPMSLPTSASPGVRSLWLRCERHVKDYNQRRESVRSRLRMARQRGGNTQAEAERAMRALEIESATRFIFPKITSTAADAGGGGGGGAAAAAAEIPADLKLLAFAMGTHERLGASSAVRLLDMDALGLIAAAVRGRRPPPPSEVVKLRRLAARQQREIDYQRSLLSRAVTDLGHRDRRAAAAAAAAVQQAVAAERERAENAADELRAKQEAAREREVAKVRREAAAAARAAEIDHELRLGRHRKEIKAYADSMVDEERRRASEAEARADEACEAAAALQGAIAALEDQLEVLRGSRVGGLLDKVKTLQATVTKLGERKKANQRKVCEANLDRHRAEQAGEKARRFEEAFKKSAVRAESSGSAWDYVDSLERELAETKALLKIQTVLRRKFQAIAEPDLPYFFHGGAYSLEHDMAGVEAMTSCQVSAGQVPKLYFIFARLFRIKLPSHSRKVPGPRAADGTRTSVLQRRYRVGGVTHWKETLAVRSHGPFREVSERPSERASPTPPPDRRRGAQGPARRLAAARRRRRLLLHRRRRQLAAAGDHGAPCVAPQQADGRARVNGNLDRRHLGQDVGRRSLEAQGGPGRGGGGVPGDGGARAARRRG